jgi:hypothetical protein
MLAQACHGALALAGAFPDDRAQWESHGGYLIVLGVDDVWALCELERTLGDGNSTVARFCEPDLGGELTALAVLPSAHGVRMLRGLRLAGSGGTANSVSSPSFREEVKS